MNPDAVKPQGRALIDHINGESSVKVKVCREDGLENLEPVEIYFRDEIHFLPLEKKALDMCSGRILDVGAGAGCHTLPLQNRGMDVTAIDISPEAVEVMKKRGVGNVHLGDIFSFSSDQFDTILLMMNGISIVESIEGLDNFLNQCKELLNPGGQVLFDSTDLRKALNDAREFEFLNDLVKQGRYFGETRFHLEYKDMKGSMFQMLFIDPDTLREEVLKTGYKCEIIMQNDFGQYLARCEM
ncbi:MAG: methyltransferase domain-containing protein [bacterium]|nr:methyltransferase domain-containing protein [bacterium]